MKTTLLTLSLLAVAPAAALAQVHVAVPVPTITFVQPPPLVVVQPGVQVVEDNDEEVFFLEDHYWVRRGDRWFRTRDHKGGWVLVDGMVPSVLVRAPPGHYRRYKKPGHRPHKASSVVINPPGPGKVKVKVKKHH